MDLKDIKKLISLMNENGLCRLEIEESGIRYVLEKPVIGLAPAAAPANFAPAFSSAQAPLPANSQPRNAAPPPSDDSKTFNSPMVGTFFASPSPGAATFVKAGDRVGPETTLCLIEAMKVFNEIKAEMSGTVVEVLAEDREAVEYNQPLFLIRQD